MITYPIIVILFFTPFPSIAEESPLSILSRYQNLQPFYETIQKPMPDKQCQSVGMGGRGGKPKQECTIIIRAEDNSQEFYKLLSSTEANFDTKDSNFLSSHLGMQYQKLKNFMQIYKNFNICKSNPDLWTEAELNRQIDHFTYLTSKGSLTTDPQCLEENPFPSSKKEEISNESLLEEKIISQSMEANIESRVFLAKKYKNQNLTDPSFKEALVKDLCETNVQQCIDGFSFKGTSAKDFCEKKSKTKESKKSICNDDEKTSLKASIDEAIEKINKKIDIPDMNSKAIVTDVNQRISKINAHLEEYNKNRNKFLKKWKKEDENNKNQNYPYQRRESLRIKKENKRHQQLALLKEEAFSKYRTEFTQMHFEGAGEFIQTNAIRDKINLIALEESDPKMFSFFGFEKAVLKSNDNFPLLQPIDHTTAQQAVREAFSRTKDQFHDLLKMKKEKQTGEQQHFNQLNAILDDEILKKIKTNYKQKQTENIEKLIIINPGITGNILVNNPEYSHSICTVLQNMAKDKRNASLMEGSVYFGVGAGLTAVSVLTLGGGLPLWGVASAALAGASFSLADYKFQKIEASHRYKIREQMLNAYLSGSSDKKNIDKIRDEWTEIMNINFAARVSLSAGIFDLALIPVIRRAGKFAKFAKSVDNFDHHLDQNKTLVKTVLKDDQLVKIFQKNLQKNYNEEEIGEFLSFLGTLPEQKRKVILNNLKKLKKTKPLTPQNLENLAQSDTIQNTLSNSQKVDFIKTIRKQYEVINTVTENKNNFLKNRVFGPIIKALSPLEQTVFMNAAIFLSNQGHSQTEIMRSLSNLLPIPDSLPKTEDFIDPSSE